MRAIKAIDTKPEKALRSGLHRLGLRFRKNVRGLPGTPDIAIRKRRRAIFVHGCFWHQHSECQQGRLPKVRQEYWLPKLERVVEKDGEVQRALQDIGWQYLVIWECHLAKKTNEIIDEAAAFLSEGRHEKG